MNAPEPEIIFRVAKNVLETFTEIPEYKLYFWRKTDDEIRAEITDMARDGLIYSHWYADGTEVPLRQMIVMYWYVVFEFLW